MKVLINLIGGQNAPHFIAGEIIKPDKVIYLYTKDSENQKKWLASAQDNLENESILVEPFSFADCYKKISFIISKYKNDELILNYTGGTKIMSIAAFLKFKENNLRTVYIDTQDNFAIYDNEKKQKIDVKIPVEKYFLLYGHRLKEQKTENITLQEEEQREKFENILIKNPDLRELFLRFARKNNKIKATGGKDNYLITHKQNWIDFLPSNKGFKIHLQNKGGINEDFIFYGQDAIQYLTGGWFEKYLHKRLKDSGIFSDIKLNLEILTDEANQPKNEIDVAAIYRNTLYIFEFKSGGLIQDQIYKLKAIKELFGGTYSKPVIVTAFPIGESLRNRARDYNIKCIQLSKLDNFLNELKNSSSKNTNL